MPPRSRSSKPECTKAPTNPVRRNAFLVVVNEPLDSDFDAFGPFDACAIATAFGARLDLGSPTSLVDGRFHE